MYIYIYRLYIYADVKADLKQDITKLVAVSYNIL